MDSIFTECSNAARHLLEHPEEAINAGQFGRNRGLFTDLDVILAAAGVSGPWTEGQMKVAQREASQVMGGLFRSRKVVRYGPVMAIGDPDYVRLASRIVYASADNGPSEIRTPNGIFPSMFVHQDHIGRPGRRNGTARNDFEKWSDQFIDTITPVTITKLPKRGSREERDEILRLRAELALERRRAEDAEKNLRQMKEAIDGLRLLAR